MSTSTRVYGAENISRTVAQTRKGKYQGNTSVYAKPHQGEREIARRLRQAERDERTRAARLARSYWGRNGHTEYSGMTRRRNLLP